MKLDQLSLPEKKVVRAIARYHYLTSEQVTRALFAPTSGSLSRGILAKLTKAGIFHRDFVAQDNGDKHPYTKGFWSLTKKGRALACDMGIDIPPMEHAPKRTSIYYDHIIPVNDCLIACELFATRTPGVELADMVHERDMHRGANKVEIVLAGKRFRAPVLADGWVDLRLGDEQICLWLEADRDTEHVTDWIKKVSTIVAYYESGQYLERFGTKYLTVMVVAIPKTTKTAERNAAELKRWTEKILADQNKKGWAEAFKITAVNPVNVTPQEFFLGTHWQTPFQESTGTLIEDREAA